MKYTIKNNITKIQRSIAYVLLLSELLTSCGFKETILPSIQPQAPCTSTCAAPKDTSLAASDNTFQLSTTTIEGTKLTFAYTPEAGLKAKYQDSKMPESVAVQQYPVIQDVTGLKKPFSQLTKAEAALLAASGKWTVKEGALSYSGMRGRGGMPGSGAASSSGGGYPSAPSAAAAGQYDTSYELKTPTYEEVQSVQIQYLRCPVEGYQLAKVEKIVNNNRRRMYGGKKSELGERLGNAAFAPKWPNTPSEKTLRQPIHDRLMNYVTAAGLSKSSASKELWLWHGTKEALIPSILRTGYASLATTDEGFFGRGLYFTPQAKYARKPVYSDGNLLLNKVCFHSAYPVAQRSDMSQLRGRGNYQNYDANFIPIKPASSDPDEVNYYPLDGQAAVYDEFVVFESTQTLPVYWVTLQKGLPASPSLLPEIKALEDSLLSSQTALSELTVRKLANPKLKLTVEESLSVISNCLRIGAVNAERARGKDLVIFLGNTGAGKSTTINYLYGCELEEVSKEDIGMKGTGSIIRVQGSSLEKELMGIGHQKESKTFLPEIASDAQFTYCDCPGFSDNRCPEINISNAVNIRNAISAANSIKVCLLLDYPSLKTIRGKTIGDMRKSLKDLFGDEERLKLHIDSVLLGITKVPVGEEGDPESLAELHGAFSKEEVLSSHTENIVTFDPLENTIAGGLRREDLIAKITSLRAIFNPGEIFKTVLNLEDEQKLREVAENLYTKIKAAIESKHYAALCENLVTLSQLNRIPHAYISTIQTTVRGILEQYIHDLSHAATLFSLQEQFEEADRELTSLQSLAEHLSKYPGYAFVKKRYEGSAKYLICAREKSAERRKQLEEIMELKDQLQSLQTQLAQQAAKEAESSAAQAALQVQIAVIRQQHQDDTSKLHEQQQATQAAFEKKMLDASMVDKKELERELAKQQAGFAAQQVALEQQRSKMTKDHAADQAELEAYAKKLAAEKEALLSKEAGLQTAVVTKAAESNLTALRGLLGSNYVGEEAWQKLGIEVKPSELPAVPDSILFEAKRLQTKREQPLLVLDLGKSIAEMEQLCKDKDITVLSKNSGDPTKLRAETCYEAVGAGSRWLLLPGSDHGILPGSRKKIYSAQVTYMAAHYKGYVVGGVRELVTLAMLKQIQDGTVLFPAAPATEVRCNDTYETATAPDWKRRRVCLGNNSSSAAGGLVVRLVHSGLPYQEAGFFCFFAP